MSQAVDHAEIKTGQLVTMAVAIAALVLAEPRLIVALAMMFLVTALYRPLSPFVWFYRYLVKPLRLMRSDYRLDNIQPHAFGQFIGAITALAAAALLYSGFGIAGWVIVGILVALTFVSYRGWCIGCYLYFQLNRLGLGGFFRHKPTDRSRPLGSRPDTRIAGDER